MNPVEEQLPPPPQLPQPNRISTSCDRHPDEIFTGFCPSCLFERLSVLDQSAASTSTVTGRKSASSALKSIFRGSANERPSFRTRPGSFLPELRRTKSFSGGKNGGEFGFAGVFEPQRKSCDVRGRNTLFSLFNQGVASSSSSRVIAGAGTDQLEGKLKSSRSIVLELQEKDDREQEVFYEEEEEGEACCEIEEIEEPISNNTNPNLSTEEQLGEILEAEKAEFKPMKDHIDLDSQTKKVGFWSAASVFSKKLKSWTKKNNKLKKHSTVQVNKKRNCRETQSEIADYGNGRRSCDIDPRFSLDAGRMSLDYSRISLDAGRMPLDDPRFSLDAGRMSLDDPRYSFDEPRASWDGYLIGNGGRSNNFPRMPSMLSVVEGSPAPPPAVLPPLEEPRKSTNDEEFVPGGAAQTKDFYADSSSRRRKSLDRSNSIRKTVASVVAELDAVKPTPVEYLHGGLDKDDRSESFDFGFRDSGDRKGVKKSSKSWKSWNIWGLIVRKGSNKDEDEDRYSRGRSFSESWQDLSRDPRVSFNRNGFRSNSSVSWRNSYSNGSNGHTKKKSNEFMLERNRSARYSPNDVDNGLLRFYLTPLKGSRRGSNPKPKPPAYSHTVPRSMLRMY